MTRTLARVGVVGLVMLAGCGRPPSDDECRALVDRYTIGLLRAGAPHLPAGELDRLRAKAQLILRQRPELARCGPHVSRRAYACALEASSPDDIERCLL